MQSQISRGPYAYDSQGLISFRLNGVEMVAVVYERASFVKQLDEKATLHAYVNSYDSRVGECVKQAALAVIDLIPQQGRLD